LCSFLNIFAYISSSDDLGLPNAGFPDTISMSKHPSAHQSTDLVYPILHKLGEMISGA
jgi:hypothetical protein